MTAALTLDALDTAAEAFPLLRRAPLRITPAPDVDPPFDDEYRIAYPAPGQEALPLPFDADPAAPLLRLVPTGTEPLESPGAIAQLAAIAPAALAPIGTTPTAATQTRFAPTLAGRGASTLTKPDVRMLVQALCEVLSGTRPAAQLTTSVSPSVLAALRSNSGTGPWRAADGGVGPRPAVRSVHVNETSDGVLDICAVVRRGARHHALALRMRRRRTRWETTTVQVG